MKSQLYRFLWLAKILTKFAEIFYLIAIISITFQLTHSALSLALTTCLIIVGKYIGNTISYMIMNRHIAIFQSGKTILLFLLICLESNQLTFMLLYLLIFLLAIFDGLFLRHLNIPQSYLSKREDMMVTNGFLSYLDLLILISGWFIGGLILRDRSSHDVLLVSGILSLICLIVFFSIPNYRPIKNSSPLLYRKKLSLNLEFKKLHFIFLIEMMVKIVWMASILFLYVNEQLHKDEYWWGVLNTFFFVGVLFTYVTHIKIHSLIVQYQKEALIFLTIGMSILTFIMAANTNAIGSFITIFLIGLGMQLKESLFYPLLLKKAGSHSIVNYGAGVTLIMVFSILAAGCLIDKYGIESIYYITGILTLMLLPYYALGKLQ